MQIAGIGRQLQTACGMPNIENAFSNPCRRFVYGGQYMDESGKYGLADGIQAIKVVRQRAAEWGIDPNRVASWDSSREHVLLEHMDVS